MPKPSVLSLVLVSAAPTVWDEAGRLVGRASIPATDQGADALSRAAKAFAAAHPGILDVVVCGPEESTHTSGTVFAEAMGVRLRTLDDLANVDLGLWDGCHREQLEGRCPSAFRAWREQPDLIRPPEGESLADAAERALAAVRKACEKTRLARPSVGVVVRPMLWAALLARLGEEPWSAFWGLADRRAEIRSLERSMTDLTQQPISANA